jgi:hypothetical protein
MEVNAMLDEQFNKIVQALIDIRNESLKCPITDAGHKALMDKYNLFFMGSKFNTILSSELAHTLNEHFDINISLDDLNNMVPAVCGALKMSYEELQRLDKMDGKTAACFIYLH